MKPARPWMSPCPPLEFAENPRSAFQKSARALPACASPRQAGVPRNPGKSAAFGRLTKGPELVADEVQRHDEHDRDRLRFDLAEAGPVEQDQQPELVDAERRQRDDEEAHPLQ